MERVYFETFRLLCPLFADEFVRGQVPKAVWTLGVFNGSQMKWFGSWCFFGEWTGESTTSIHHRSNFAINVILFPSDMAPNRSNGWQN